MRPARAAAPGLTVRYSRTNAAIPSSRNDTNSYVRNVVSGGVVNATTGRLSESMRTSRYCSPVSASVGDVLAPHAVPKHVGSARETTARSQIEMLGAALDAFRLHVGRYPTSQEGLAALWERPASAPSTWRGPYLRRAVPVDPWGHAYVYEGPGTQAEMTYRVTSLGADGKRGGDGEAGDISAQ